MERPADKIYDVLKRYWGFTEFRPVQERIIRSVMDGRDTLALMPTGGGKSLTFQLPALMAGQTARGLTVVISPLQSLMKDQVDHLVAAGISEAVTINGQLDPVESAKAYELIVDGTASLLYIAPETLRSKTMRRALLTRHIERFVIDEAHCFSAWGQDFRVDYLFIADFIAALSKEKGGIPIPVSCFTATAKRKVFGKVGIDMIAGPSEILVLADGGCNPAWVAADLLSQAEHDKLASPVLVTDSPALARAVQAELEVQIPQLPRAAIARASVDDNGKIIVCSDLRKAIEACNIIAPEHLEVCVDAPFSVLNEIKNAGSIFLGRNVPEALGDYFAGPNHTLPTSGTARFSSPLGVDDFVKKSSFIYYTREALEKAAPRIADFAEREGLHAHARSVTIRYE